MHPRPVNGFGVSKSDYRALTEDALSGKDALERAVGGDLSNVAGVARLTSGTKGGG